MKPIKIRYKFGLQFQKLPASSRKFCPVTLESHNTFTGSYEKVVEEFEKLTVFFE